MSEKVNYLDWVRHHSSQIVAALKRDRYRIALATVLVAVVGGMVGRLGKSTTSTAQLVVTPIPLRQTFDPAKSPDDQLARMLALPLDLKTAALLCMSDDVLEKTRAALNNKPEFGRTIKALAQLRNTLRYKITVSKDTPYETVYSPILELTARASTPAQAKLMADTWAEQCVTASKSFQQKNQAPLAEAFEEQATVLSGELGKAEKDYEDFKKENSLVYLRNHLEGLVEALNLLEEARGRLEEEGTEAAGRVEAYAAQKLVEPLLFERNWRLPEGTLSALAGKMGKPAASPEASGEKLTIETINDAHVRILTELAIAKAEKDGKQRSLDRLMEVISEFKGEIKSWQEVLGEAEMRDKYLGRNVTVLEVAYLDAAKRLEFAKIAANLTPPQLQLLSRGAEWRIARFRPAIMFGILAGFWGFVCAAGLSVLIRFFRFPEKAEAKD